MNETLPCVEIEPEQGPAQRSVIWLHGLGANGHDFEPIVPYLGLDRSLAVRFVFPHAPPIPVTINMGLIMPAWYDITEMDLRHRHDMDGVRRSAAHVRRLIERENERGVPTERIVLAGFSQGGAVALYTGLRYPERLAGMLALSCYLVDDDALDSERSQAQSGLPIFQAHGEYDPMVPVERGRAAHVRLLALGYDVVWKTYPMQHEVHPVEIRDIGSWLGKR